LLSLSQVSCHLLVSLSLKLRHIATASEKLTFPQAACIKDLTPMQLESIACHRLMTSLVYLGIVLARAEGPTNLKAASQKLKITNLNQSLKCLRRNSSKPKPNSSTRKGTSNGPLSFCLVEPDATDHVRNGAGRRDFTISLTHENQQSAINRYHRRRNI
jgi:hypothetical protein